MTLKYQVVKWVVRDGRQKRNREGHCQFQEHLWKGRCVFLPAILLRQSFREQPSISVFFCDGLYALFIAMVFVP